jgi:predicted O-methyltransferase YrrM
MHHSDFIAILAGIVKPKNFVELGLYQGECIRKIIPHVEKYYGVDMKTNEHLSKLEEQYKGKLEISYCTTDRFFETFNEKIGMCFIDADHSAESAMKDFENCLRLSDDQTVFLIHDLDPINNDYMADGYCGSSYKILPILEARDDINVVCLPILEAGLGIVTKKNSSRTFLRNGPQFYKQ